MSCYVVQVLGDVLCRNSFEVIFLNKFRSFFMLLDDQVDSFGEVGDGVHVFIRFINGLFHSIGLIGYEVEFVLMRSIQHVGRIKVSWEFYSSVSGIKDGIFVEAFLVSCENSVQ